jgi:hypothetical protein
MLICIYISLTKVSIYMNEESIYYMLINIVFKVIKKARLDRDLSSRDVKMSIQTENVK